MIQLTLSIFYVIYLLTNHVQSEEQVGCGYPPFTGNAQCSPAPEGTLQKSRLYYGTYKAVEYMYMFSNEYQKSYDGDDKGENHCGLFQGYPRCGVVSVVQITVFLPSYDFRIRTLTQGYSYGVPEVEPYSIIEHYLTSCPGDYLCGQGNLQNQLTSDGISGCKRYKQPTNASLEYKAATDTICITRLDENGARIVNSIGQAYSGPSYYYCERNRTRCAQDLPAGSGNDPYYVNLGYSLLGPYLNFTNTCPLYYRGK